MTDLAQNLDRWIASRINRHQQAAYALIDEQATILRVDSLMRQWFSGKGEAIRGRSITDLLPQFLGWEEDIFSSIKSNQEAFIIPQVDMTLVDGSERFFDLIVEYMPEAQEAFLVMLIDVSKQTRLQQMLVQQRNELQLYINRLETTARERDQLIEDLDAFTHTVAHDLKSPVTTIIGYSNLLQSEELPEAMAQQSIDIVKKNCFRMSSMIDELLLLANVQQHKVEPQPVDMATAVDGALERLRFLIEEDSAVIILPPSWPATFGYTPWVEEIWANYISNGIKYGGRPPRLELGFQAEQDDAVKFFVTDNGPGLSPEECELLFSKFTRLSETKIEGHGLGLSIVKRIATKLGGEVGVESEPGQGSTFHFTLPIQPPHDFQADLLNTIAALTEDS